MTNAFRVSPRQGSATPTVAASCTAECVTSTSSTSLSAKTTTPVSASTMRHSVSEIGAAQRTLFHELRRTGNEAVHDFAGTQSEALHQLKSAHQLAIWF